MLINNKIKRAIYVIIKCQCNNVLITYSKQHYIKSSFNYLCYSTTPVLENLTVQYMLTNPQLFLTRTWVNQIEMANFLLPNDQDVTNIFKTKSDTFSEVGR